MPSNNLGSFVANVDQVSLIDGGMARTPFDSELPANGGDLFIGSLDEVAFWQRALSNAEVAAIFSSPVPLQ